MSRSLSIFFALLMLMAVSSCRSESTNGKPTQTLQSIGTASPPNTQIRVEEYGELITPTITSGIDITKYEQLGHFDCRQWAAADSVKRSAFYEKRKEAKLERVRALIWSRWQQRKPSYLRVTYDSIDAVTTHHIFIDLDQSGKRQLILRSLCTYGDSSISDYPPIHHLEYKGTEKKPSVLVFKNDVGAMIVYL